MDALFRAIYDTGSAMKAFIWSDNPWDFGVCNELEHIFWTGFEAEFAARTARAVNLDRHINSSD